MASFNAFRAGTGASILSGLILLLAGCAAEPPRDRVLLLGLDGMDPRAIELLASEGKLPNFVRLQAEGAYTTLRSQHPLMSPVIWTTIATGRTPDEHGIGHFVAVNEKTGRMLPVTSRMRKVPALWNIASANDRSVAVVGWWATWPAESVRGSIVSDHLNYHFLLDQPDSGRTLAPGKTYPEELQERLVPLVTTPEEIGIETLEPFAAITQADLDRPFDYRDDLSHLRWALAAMWSNEAIGLELWREERPDLGMIYIEGTDSVSHLFGHLFRAEGLGGDLAHQQKTFGGAVEQVYVAADRLLGRVIDALDEGTTLIVLSDHGFELGYLPRNPELMKRLQRVRTEQHTLDGIVYFFGNRVRKGAEMKQPSILDVTPTVLALLGIPPSREMPGRILVEALEVEVPPRVESWEVASGPTVSVAQDPAGEAAILERLTALGYLDASSPAADRTMAGVLFEQGRFDESLEAYRRLVEEFPEDASLRVSLAGVLGKLERYEEALEELDLAVDLAPLHPAAHHNRGVVAERMGDVGRAIEAYREALRYSPGYEPSARALDRLGVPREETATTSEAVREARRLADEAALAARRGDYPAALDLLERAEGLAPDYALIFQYRSNVAYLMGDRDAAIAALERAIELEPDSALFRENLRTLLGGNTPD